METHLHIKNKKKRKDENLAKQVDKIAEMRKVAALDNPFRSCHLVQKCHSNGAQNVRFRGEIHRLTPENQNLNCCGFCHVGVTTKFSFFLFISNFQIKYPRRIERQKIVNGNRRRDARLDNKSRERNHGMCTSTSTVLVFNSRHFVHFPPVEL